MTFEPTLQSVKSHQVPQWYHDAKLGIFIHWGLYSVPAWAAHGGDLGTIQETGGWREWFKNNSYAEWYLNTLKFEDGPTREYHNQTYGADFDYDQFAPMFNEAVANWNPNDMARLFEKVGARYVVLTTKHHDGFTLWPTKYPCPRKDNYFTQRDLVGELTDAVRQHNMKMGLYYSGGLDWAFNETRIEDMEDVRGTIVEEPEFVDYSLAHWRELIDVYQPAILWNDIGYPSDADLPELFAYYYNNVTDGVINDRFTQVRDLPPGQRGPSFTLPKKQHYDFVTPEYRTFSEIQEKKWETCRGIGHSFGYNRNEGDEQLIAPDALVHMFVDVVSKNGNLLLNVGPMADGTIPQNQQQRLETLGDWLAINGEAIFSTRPWSRAEGKTSQGVGVRFTKTDNNLYATLMGTPAESQITIEGLDVPADSTIHLLGQSDPLTWQRVGSDVRIDLTNLPDMPAHSLKISGI
ncbi:MAG: alpha-L-fucosidase [Anaerolineaceae bacterium]|nr:alpha-L-fucosidase [Anaerolineaceae bacterium]